MDQLNINEIPLPHDGCCCGIYGGMAFDGCNFFFPVKGKKQLVKYGPCFQRDRCIDVYKEYNVICYDFVSRCFWAMSHSFNCCLFKLDEELREIDCVPLPPCEVRGVRITGLSFDCCENCVLISTDICILSLDKSTEELSLIRYYPESCVTGILSICPGYMVTAIKDRIQYLYTYNEDGCLINERILPACYTINTIVFDPCHKPSPNLPCPPIVIYILANKRGCYPYVLEVPIDSHELGFTPAECNYDICKCCDDSHEKPIHCGKTEIIQSIAKVETALSHILNAEGEKLQKVIASTSDINAIMCVNKEVNRTIINATHLEIALYNKLSALGTCCDDCHDCPCDCSCQCGCGYPDGDNFFPGLKDLHMKQNCMFGDDG